MTIFRIANHPMHTTAAPALQPTGTALRTMLQVATPTTNGLKIVRWGVRFATALTATAVCELVETGGVGASALTAHAATAIQAQDDTDPVPSAAWPFTLATTGTGFATAAPTEGATTALREFDTWPAVIGEYRYEWEWSLGREPRVAVSRFLRIRITTATTINAVVWVDAEPL